MIRPLTRAGPGPDRLSIGGRSAGRAVITDPGRLACRCRADQPGGRRMVAQLSRQPAQSLCRPALRYNSDVLIARERVNEYQARAYAADSTLFPALDASLTGSRARAQSAATGLPVHSTVYKGGLTASYDVDIWRQPRGQRRAGESGGAKAAAAAADLTVATSVAAGI